MEEKEISYINAIPLVDIMLVLLAIVLTTATFITQGAIRVDLPQSASKDRVEEKENLVITITGEDRIFLDDRPLSREELDGVLKSVDKERGVEIFADKQVVIATLVAVMDIVKANGFGSLAIKTKG